MSFKEEPQEKKNRFYVKKFLTKYKWIFKDTQIHLMSPQVSTRIPHIKRVKKSSLAKY